MIGKRGTRPLLVLVSVVLAASLLGACGSSSSESGADQFRDQTKNGLLDFGEEAAETERDEATEAVEAFLTARAEADWAAACAQLSRSLLTKIERLARTATELEDTSCPSFLGTFSRLSAEEREDSPTVETGGSLRQRGAKAHLVYYGADEMVYAMPLSREGDAWKMDALAPKLLS
ncbi:MAG TPA: hypothetical protein VFS48_01010 [Solirubrobacterales bacterium]|nr:hypothetical protein [Solirubrobacterales bacterium]